MTEIIYIVIGFIIAKLIPIHALKINPPKGGLYKRFIHELEINPTVVVSPILVIMIMIIILFSAFCGKTCAVH
jgi:hypothetical protein